MRWQPCWPVGRPGGKSSPVLDVACGSGLYSLTLAEEHPHAEATLLDWPNVLAITRGTVERLGLTERTLHRG
jgi:methylase of polypeptide subunit release factors